jgi:hypothetical protein
LGLHFLNLRRFFLSLEVELEILNSDNPDVLTFAAGRIGKRTRKTASCLFFFSKLFSPFFLFFLSKSLYFCTERRKTLDETTEHSRATPRAFQGQSDRARRDRRWGGLFLEFFFLFCRPSHKTKRHIKI